MIELTPLAKNARLAGLRDLIDTGTGTAAILFYAAPQPAVGDPAAGTLLATAALSSPCGVIIDGELILAAPEWVNVAASGDIAWARVVNADGAIVADMGVGLTGSGADIEINSLTVYAGGLLHIDTAILRE